MRRVACLVLAAFVGGCGAGGGAGGTTASDLGLRQANQARDCLTSAGLSVMGGPKGPDDRNAPSVELIANANDGQAFIGFYRNAGRARHFEGQLRHNAKRFDGSVERQGSVSIVWTHKPSSASMLIERCAFAGA